MEFKKPMDMSEVFKCSTNDEKIVNTDKLRNDKRQNRSVKYYIYVKPQNNQRRKRKTSENIFKFSID